MNLMINNVPLNKEELLSLLNDDSKIQAIKYVKDKTNLGLKECKDIIDHLDDDPDFYDGKEYISAVGDVAFSNEPKKAKPFKGSHVLDNNTSKSKNYLIVFLFICICFLAYYFLFT